MLGLSFDIEIKGQSETKVNKSIYNNNRLLNVCIWRSIIFEKGVS